MTTDDVIAPVPEAIEEFRNGKFIVITDDEDRENEGDLVIGAQFITPEAINFMAKYGRGLICCPLTEERVGELQLPMMVDNTATTRPTSNAVRVLYRAREKISCPIKLVPNQ